MKSIKKRGHDVARAAKLLLRNQKNGLYPDQKSEEWYADRINSLTASDCATALDCNVYETSLELLVKKVSASDSSASLRSQSNMSWGNKYEPIARDFYENMFNEKVYELGLVKHSIHKWLGASPDGIMLNGKLLEIKCPVHRKIGDIPYYYWIQVQIQLAVCGLDECDFLDCKFEECSKEQYDLISDETMKGIIQPLQMDLLESDDGKLSPTIMELMKGVKTEKVTYWHLKHYSIQTIRKDSKWFVDNINHLKTFWDKVIHYRQKGQKKLHEDTRLFASVARRRSASESEPFHTPVSTNTSRSKRKSNVLQDNPEDILPNPNRVLRFAKKQKVIEKESSDESDYASSDESDTSTCKTSNLIDWNKWVSATKTRNYVIEDPLIDWLEFHGNHHMVLETDDQEESDFLGFQPGDLQTPLFGAMPEQSHRANYDVGDQFESDFRNSRLFTDFLKENGTKFEKYAMKELFNRFPDDILNVANQYQARSFRKYEETVEAMNKGIPIIYHGVLHNHKNRTYGMPDLIVRSDWLNKVFNDPIISETSEKESARSLRLTKDPGLGNPGTRESWHYRIVDIKFTTLALRADGKHMLKNNSVEAMKAQLYIYNMALSAIQGYNSPKAYIIGRKWQYRKCGVIHSGNNWFDKAGHVNFKNTDRHIRKKTRDALVWIHKVRRHGHEFTLKPPSCPELYPNMCNGLDGPWRRVKKKIADEIHEITSLWNCGPKNRRAAHARGILGWDNPKCCSEHLGITGDRVISTLQQIIDVNQNSKINYLLNTHKEKETTFDKEDLENIREVIRNDTEIIIPHKIECNTLRKWHGTKNLYKNKKILFFIDFETITDLTLDESLGSSFIFMIGVGYRNISSQEWTYQCFYTNELTEVEELRIFKEFHKFVHGFATKGKKTTYPDLIHWSHAEKTFYNAAWGRHGDLILSAGYQKMETWCDMLKVFRNEPITIRGALNFSLKSVAKAFYEHGLIKTTWDADSDVCDGMSAMIQAHRAYKSAAHNNITNIMLLPIMRDIKHYNEIDCKVLYDILTYLVKHH